jgi:hypothetical protein
VHRFLQVAATGEVTGVIELAVVTWRYLGKLELITASPLATKNRELAVVARVLGQARTSG